MMLRCPLLATATTAAERNHGFEESRAVAYRTLSSHAERRVVLPAGRPVGHVLRLSHVELESDGAAVQLAALTPGD